MESFHAVCTMNRLIRYMVMACVGFAPAALSAVQTNQTTAAGSWHAGGNWSLTHEPAAGEAVVVKHDMLLTTSTPRLWT